LNALDFVGLLGIQADRIGNIALDPDDEKSSGPMNLI
jgi:hypothetical protein